MVQINNHTIEKHDLYLLYKVFGYVHVINAVMYLWVWAEEKKPIFSLFCLPDWLNVLGSFLYLATSYMYHLEYVLVEGEYVHSQLFPAVRRIELAAALIELGAAIGWVAQWRAVLLADYLRSPESTLGRGFTLDDPDMWANISVIVGAGLYVQYNLIVVINPSHYETSDIYVTGDLWYLSNALFYLLCSFRDCEFLWFMPIAGRFPNLIALASAHHRGDDSATDGTGVWLLEKDRGERERDDEGVN